MQLIDTHCHIHSSSFPLDAEKTYQEAIAAGVTKLICVGTDAEDSKLAAEWALEHEKSWASVGVHPHEAKHGVGGIEPLLKDAQLMPKIVAVGETGLDYHYTHSPKDRQIMALEAQLQLAQTYNLPVIFHMRNASEDFWPAFSQFHGIKGVMHSFTDTAATLERALTEGLYIGVNGIASFTRDEAQVELYKSVPLESLLLETDAPYLTPVPHRGKVNQPAYVRLVARCLSEMRSIPVETIARHSSHNATHLFHI